jgi:hypothetical protein
MKRTSDKPTQSKFGLLDEYIDTEELAREINRHPITLIKWRRQGIGPPATYLGRRVLYHVPSAKAWLRSQEKPR